MLPAAESDLKHSCSCDILNIFLEETSGDNNCNLKNTGIPDFLANLQSGSLESMVLAEIQSQSADFGRKLRSV